MKLFECQICGQLLFFHNTRCERCGHALGYLPERSLLCALTAEGETAGALRTGSARSSVSVLMLPTTPATG